MQNVTNINIVRAATILSGLAVLMQANAQAFEATTSFTNTTNTPTPSTSESAGNIALKTLSIVLPIFVFCGFCTLLCLTCGKTAKSKSPYEGTPLSGITESPTTFARHSSHKYEDKDSVSPDFPH